MKIYTMLHQTPGGSSQDGTGYADAIDIVGVYKDPKESLSAFNFYLDQLEKHFREGTEVIDKSNTFNRFSEPSEKVLATADIDESGGWGPPAHSVWISINELE